MANAKPDIKREEQFLRHMLLILIFFLFIVVVGLGLVGYRRLTGQAILSREKALLRPFTPYLPKDILGALRQRREFTLNDIAPSWLEKPTPVASVSSQNE